MSDELVKRFAEVMNREDTPEQNAQAIIDEFGIEDSVIGHVLSHRPATVIHHFNGRWSEDGEPTEAPAPPPVKPRLRHCVEAWPECVSGDYHPSCCRFPKSCSCTAYDPEKIDPERLEER